MRTDRQAFLAVLRHICVNFRCDHTRGGGGGGKLNYRCISVITVECKNLSSFLLSRLSLYADELVEIVVEYFSVIEQLLIVSCICQCWSRNGSA